MADGKITKAESDKALKIIGVKSSTTTNVITSFDDYQVTTKKSTISIGKADISVEFKNAESTKNNSKALGINTSVTTHYNAYVFYLPEWRNEANDDKLSITSFYGMDTDDIGTADVTNADELTNAWNSMGKPDDKNYISLVVINTHADPDGLVFNKYNMISNQDISMLDNKRVSNTILYGCNAGHLDYKDNNPASNFTHKVNGGLVLASDGTDESNGRILWWFGATGFESKNDEVFKRWLPKGSKRNNEGWITYQDKDGKINISDSLGKKLTLSQMLEKIR